MKITRPTINMLPDDTENVLAGRLMIRASEYAALTGTPLPTVYKYLNSGEIPVIRIGHTVRIPVSALAAKLAEVKR